ncbi:unnamed protein product [Cladocopium goreaui]|uniref:Phenylalanine--tRNA ligase n=1 Tax=Cladocopium goreaui TaxID=2562237 RepID=A0A9P1CK62_9DINO|nr:unnamed protein product [Cladocopium goreaui]
MATPAKPPEGDAEKMAGPWSRISAETIQVDEQLKTWTLEERSQYLENQGIVTAKQEQLSRFLSELLVECALPAPWQFCRDENKIVFFWNQNTNETSWVHPLDLTLREVAAVFLTCLQLPPVLRNQSLNALQESWEASIAELLLGWEQAEDEEGQKYFQNESKGESMWEHPSQVFLPIQNMKEYALNRIRDLAYLEQIGAVPSKGGSKEVYQALKTSKLKLAEHISMLSPTSKTKLAASPDTEESEIVVEQIDSKDSPDAAAPTSDTAAASPPTTGASTNTTMASTGELKKPASRERNGAQARSVLRIAGDILQARSTAPLQSRRPSLHRNNRMQQQRLLRSASESQLKFNWSAQPVDLKQSLTMEEKIWWWPCAPKR